MVNPDWVAGGFVAAVVATFFVTPARLVALGFLLGAATAAGCAYWLAALAQGGRAATRGEVEAAVDSEGRPLEPGSEAALLAAVDAPWPARAALGRAGLAAAASDALDQQKAATSACRSSRHGGAARLPLSLYQRCGQGRRARERERSEGRVRWPSSTSTTSS